MLNLYGLVILIIISILICYGVISHYADINNGAYNQRVDEIDPFPLIVPKGRVQLIFKCKLKDGSIKVTGCYPSTDLY